MAEGEEGGLGSLFKKAGKWLGEHGVTEEDLAKAKEDMAGAKVQSDRMEAEAEEARTTEARDDRQRRAGGSRLTLAGAIEGTVDSGLSVQIERDDGSLLVSVEAVDPIPLRGGRLIGLSFGIPAYAGPGTYDLASADLSGQVYELSFDDVDEGFFWAPEYGPGVVTVSAGEASADIHFVYQDPGSRRIELKGSLELR